MGPPAMGPPPAAALPPAPVAAPMPPVAPSPANAAAAPVVPDPAVAGVSRWGVAPGSTISFATSWGGAPIQGRFDKWVGGIVFGPDALDRSMVTIRIDLASVNTGDAQRDGSLPSSDWFDTANHPEAEFTAKRFEKVGPDRYVARGALQLRGVSKPLSLPFTLHISGDTAQVSGVTSLDRTAFGVGQGEWAKTDQIPGKVTVKVDLKATRR